MKKIFAVLSLFLVVSCGGASNDSGTPGSVPEVPGAPTLASADKQISVSWNSVTSAVSYEVWYGIQNNTSSASRFADPIETDTVCVITGLANDTEYYVWIKAKNSAGTSSFSEPSKATPFKAVVKPAAPSAPVLVQGDARISVSWTPVSGATSYETWYGTSGSSSNAVKAEDADDTDTGCTIAELSNGTEYYVWIKAKNSAGVSDFSGSSKATPVAPVTKPSAPAAPLLTIRNCQITASWAAVSNATSYETWYSKTNNISNAVKFSDPADSDTTCAITGLTNGVTYYIWIKAKNSAGTSDSSPVSSIAPSFLDPSFGSAGISVISPNSRTGIINMCAGGMITSDGKILITGTSNSNFCVVKMLSSGLLDSGFGSGGIVSTDINSGSTDTVVACAMQSDNKFLVLGTSGNTVAIVRYNSNGSLDSGFGTSGIVLNSSMIKPKSVAVTGNNKIIIVGSKDYTTYTDIAALCLNSDGSLDTAFGTSGLSSWHTQTTSEGSAVIVQNDGKIVISGWYDDYGTLAGTTATMHFYGFIAIRLDASGVDDPSFGTNGKQTLNFTGHKESVAMDVQSDGKIVLAGRAFSEYHSSGGSNDDIFICRLNTNGSLDTAFNSSGYLLFNIDDVSQYGYKDDFARSVKVMPGGKILVSATFIQSSRQSYHSGLVVLNPDGSKDNTFGNRGYFEYNVDDTNNYQSWFAGVQKDGMIVSIGTVDLTSQYAPASYFVMRFIP
jgi:uncharacterized delta-60 repeat protein